MSETSNEQKPGMTRSKKIRYALYIIILAAVLLWQRHEAIITNEARYIAENTAVDAAYILMRKAAASKDPVEQLRICDEVINTYRNDATWLTDRAVIWCMYKKATLVTDPQKSALLEEIIDTYGHDPDTQ